MDTVWLAFTLLDWCSLLLNLFTLGFVVKHFDLKVHVFLLVFWDALLTTLGSLTATLVEN
jgi:hypothetical protein